MVGGGRLLLMIGQSKSPEIADLVAEWGIRIKDDTIVDLTGIGQLFGGGPLTPLVANYEDHPITEVMGSAATFFPYARTVEPGDPVANWKVDQLFSTTSGSFATEKLEIVDQELVRNSARETEGPISVAVAATHDIPEKTEDSESSSENEEVIGSEESEKQGRVVVIGSSRFARNYSLGRGSNLDLLLNALNWLSSDEDLISIRPSDPENTPLDLTQSDMTKLFFLTVIGLPTLIVILGLWVWWRRR